jgi:tetratricopeptide (TPR) repeat protein
MMVFLLLLCGTVPKSQAQFTKIEAQVRAALHADKPYKALAKAQGALSRKEVPPVFYVLRADAYVRIGEYAKALRDAGTARALLGDTQEVRSQLIGAHLGLGQVDSALYYIVGSPEQVDDAEYAYRVAGTYQRAGDRVKAREILDRSIMAFPGVARLLRERGACHAMLGDSARARSDFDQAVELAPRDAVNYNSRGFYRYALFGDHKRAVADMDRAIKQDPNYGYAFSNRGWSRFQLGETVKARKDLQLAIRKNPGNAYAYRSLGLIELAAGSKELACERFSKALELRFTAYHGGEVEQLMQEHCTDLHRPAVPIVPSVPADPPPPYNAPATPKSKQGNAP